MLVVTVRSALIVPLVLLGLAGCATPRASETITPQIAISPGVAGRLALMDRYRLHDEDRKRMMERPHVWVEEAPEEEAEETELMPAPAESPQSQVVFTVVEKR